jgi:MFS family permease
VVTILLWRKGVEIVGIDRDVAPSERGRTRATATIFAAVALGSTSLYAAFTAAPLVATEMTGTRATSGVPGATAILGTAVGSVFLSSVMARRGRRSGLRLGYVIGLVGAVSALVVTGASAGFVLFVAAMFLLGIGHASNQLSRFAAADMHDAATRAPVLGWIVWAGTVGAILGPPLLRAGEPIAEAAGRPSLSGAMLFASLFYLAALMTVLAMRTDPSDIAVEDTSGVEADPSASRLSAMWKLAHVRLALTVMVVGQAAMVLVMTMTPVHVRDHGHGLGIVGGIMTAHFVGMFALAPFVGKIVARRGTVPAILFGLGLLIAGAGGAALSPTSSGASLALSLFVVGLGWCFGFVSASILLTQGLAYAERVRVQGSVDGIAWLAAAIASVASGFLLAGFGFTVLCLLAAIGVLLTMAFVAMRREAVGAPAEGTAAG